MQTDYDKSLGNIIYKARVLIKNRLQKNLKSFNITPEQWNVMENIKSREGCNQRELAEKCLKDRASLTRILDALEKKGIIKRVTSALDRREFLIYLTEEGVCIYNKIIPVVKETREENYKNFTKEEIETMRDLIGRLVLDLDKL